MERGYTYTAAWILISYLILPAANGQAVHPRAWAEWEETEGIIIHQPNFYKDDASPVDLMVAEEWDSLYLDLIRVAMDEGVSIYYILDTSNRPEYHSGILDTLHVKYGIDIDDPGFHVIRTTKDSYPRLTKWTRDHGPMNVYRQRIDSLCLYLFRDDALGSGGIISDYLQLPDTVFMDNQSSSLASDGGNYMVDGNSMGIIDNGPGAMLPVYRAFFGLDTVYAFPNYLFHADYYLKIVNEETMIVSKQLPQNYTTGNEPYNYQEDTAILQAAVRYIQDDIISQYGRPMKVFEIPNPPSLMDDSLRLWYYTQYASYTNSLIVNRKVFVPQYEVPGYDSLAMELYRKAMPGYHIVPVFSRRGASAGGAVHCLTNSIASPEPVLIRHAWFPDTVGSAEMYEFPASIESSSGIAEALLYWSNNSKGPFHPVVMENMDGEIYRGILQIQPGQEEVFYYIEARANSGKSGRKPMVAPEGAYHFVIRKEGPGWISHVEKASGYMAIYPNPAREKLTIEVRESSMTIASSLSLAMYDLMGNKVSGRMVRKPFGKICLNIGHLTPGYYFVVLMDEKGRFLHGRFIKV